MYSYPPNQSRQYQPQNPDQPVYPQSDINMNQVMMGQQAQGIAIHSGLDQHLENKDDPITDLNDEMVRNGFIRKVYSILSLQLLITTLFCAYGMTHQAFFKFQMEHMGILWLMIAIQIVTMIALGCFQYVGRTVPLNYALLFVFTLSESYLVSFCCSCYSTRVVIMAAVFTLAITLSLTVYTFTTTSDPTVYGSMLFAALSILLVAGIFMMFTTSPLAQIIYCSFGALVYAGYIVYDTALILGKFGQKFSVDDYIFASISIYVDVIGLFLRIMEIVDQVSSN